MTQAWDEYIVEKYVTAMMLETGKSPPLSLHLPHDANLTMVTIETYIPHPIPPEFEVIRQISDRCFGKGVFVFNTLAVLTGKGS